MSSSKNLRPLLAGGGLVACLVAVALAVGLSLKPAPLQELDPVEDALGAQALETSPEDAPRQAPVQQPLRVEQPRPAPPRPAEQELSQEEREAWAQAERAGTDIVYETEPEAAPEVAPLEDEPSGLSVAPPPPKQERSGPDVLRVRRFKPLTAADVPSLKESARQLDTGAFMNAQALERAQIKNKTLPYVLSPIKKLPINKDLPTTMQDKPSKPFVQGEHIRENYPGE